jgi:hypothetical protein
MEYDPVFNLVYLTHFTAFFACLALRSREKSLIQ